MIFFPGSTGVIYRQFSVTVIASMLLSVVVALVLSPVLCASLLKPVEKGHEAAETGFRLLRPFFLWFDRIFFRLRDAYRRRVEGILGRKLRFVVVFLLIVAGMVLPLPADADRVPPRRGPGHPHDHGPAARSAPRWSRPRRSWTRCGATSSARSPRPWSRA